MYGILRSLLFQLDAERAHHMALRLSRGVLAIPGGHRLAFPPRDTRDSLRVDTMHLSFRNPVGLAAGFDKNGEYIKIWDRMGMGFIELGTVTPRPQLGNPKPRLFRLKSDRAIINRMGFNNAGVDALHQNIIKYDRRDLIIGGNIGKNKDTPLEDAWRDYRLCTERLGPSVDYIVVNVSSPNTPGLRNLQDKEPLYKILSEVQNKNIGSRSPRPVLLKIAPDLSAAALEDIAWVHGAAGLSGLIVTNTTIDRSGLCADPDRLEEIGAGGLSGAPLSRRAQNWCEIARKRLPDTCIIGVGGIHNRSTAQARLEAGADLIQLYTGLVYEGPPLIQKILRGLGNPK